MMYEKLISVYTGPFCDVYKARDECGSTVALKVVDPDFIRRPHNFKNEVKIMKSLSHPNVVEFLDTYAMGEDHYLVMPFYEKTLADVMKHYAKKKMKFDLSNPQHTSVTTINDLPPDSADSIVWGLVNALEYVHGQGILHRDVKPSNIFFRDIDGLGIPILGDFGISYNCINPLSDEPWDEKVTDIATGYYKAPELCFAVCDYGPEVDLWSLGILISVLYSLNGEPANHVPDQHSNERSPELNDFVLLQGTFEAFGTPIVDDKSNELYCPALANPSLHFIDFKFTEHSRRSRAQLLPRCVNEQIAQLFEGLTRYDKRQTRHPTSDKGKKE